MKKPEKNVNLKKIISLIIAVGFFAYLVIFALLTVITPKSDFSETENRLLVSFPKISFRNIIDKDVMNGIDTFVSDHFFERVNWVKLKTSADIALGRRSENGVFICKDNSRFAEEVADFDSETVNKSIAGINNFAQTHDIETYFMLVPTAAAIYADELPENAPNINQEDFTDTVYSALSPKITTIDIYPVMEANRDDYTYYRTDHHWTTRGAYNAYLYLGAVMGFEPFRVFDRQTAADGFLGSLYSKVLYDGVESDNIEFFLPQGGTKITSVEVTKEYGSPPEITDSVYFREFLDKKDKYSVFLGQNQPLVTVKSGAAGEKLLVIKDSYANTLAPMLGESFSEVTYLDMRYIQTGIDNIIDVEGYDKVLILYNVSSFMTDTHLRKLSFE
jgi:hypothetical protein